VLAVFCDGVVKVAGLGTVTYLVDRHAGGIVLVVALCVDELGSQSIASPAPRAGGCRRGRQVMAVQVDLLQDLALGLVGAIDLLRSHCEDLHSIALFLRSKGGRTARMLILAFFWRICSPVTDGESLP